MSYPFFFIMLVMSFITFSSLPPIYIAYKSFGKINRWDFQKFNYWNVFPILSMVSILLFFMGFHILFYISKILMPSHWWEVFLVRHELSTVLRKCWDSRIEKVCWLPVLLRKHKSQVHKSLWFKIWIREVTQST